MTVDEPDKTGYNRQDRTDRRFCGPEKGNPMRDTLRLAGAPVAKALADWIDARMVELSERDIVPGLGILQIGDAPDDMAYERMAIKKCDQFGLTHRIQVLAPDCAFREFREVFDSLNNDDRIDGILILGAFPGAEHQNYVQSHIVHRKDIDAIGHESIARLYSSTPDAVAPCTVEAVLELLDHYQLDVKGKRVCVLGRSLVIGRPLALALVNRSATVQICHSRTADLASETLRADYVFCSIGKARMLGTDHIGEGATVIDVGINYDETGKMCGDADYEALQGHAAAVTPVPGGVGAVTNTVLIKHIIASAMKRS